MTENTRRSAVESALIAMHPGLPAVLDAKANRDALVAVIGTERNGWMASFAHASHHIARAIVEGRLDADTVTAFRPYGGAEAEARHIAEAAGLRFIGADDEDRVGRGSADHEDVSVSVQALTALTSDDPSIGLGDKRSDVWQLDADTLAEVGTDEASVQAAVRGMTLVEAARLILDGDEWMTCGAGAAFWQRRIAERPKPAPQPAPATTFADGYQAGMRDIARELDTGGWPAVEAWLINNNDDSEHMNAIKARAAFAQIRDDRETLRAQLVERLRATLADRDGAYEVRERVETGGGCEAMLITAPDGREVYLTDGDSALPYDDVHSPRVDVSFYDADQEYEGACTVADAASQELGVVIRAWADGTPVLDMQGLLG